MLRKDLLNYVQTKNELALYYHPETVHVVAKWVDDVITRGDRKVTEEFWRRMEERWKIKSWGIVTEEKPRVYCSKKIGMETDAAGKQTYYVTQEDDIKQWLVDTGVTGITRIVPPGGGGNCMDLSDSVIQLLWTQRLGVMLSRSNTMS